MEVARRTPQLRRKTARPMKAARKRNITAARVRSALTNGSTLLDCDHRSAWMRRLRDLIVEHENDLGGEDYVSESERRLVRRSAMLTLQLEMMEQHWASNNGEAKPSSLELYQRTSSALRRLLESLGLQRRSRDVTPPTVEQYLAHVNAQREAAE